MKELTNLKVKPRNENGAGCCKYEEKDRGGFEIDL